MNGMHKQDAQVTITFSLFSTRGQQKLKDKKGAALPLGILSSKIHFSCGKVP